MSFIRPSGGGGGGSSGITPSLVAYRSSGVAPFATGYDATATTATGFSSDEVFRKFYYLFEVQQGGTTVSGTYSNGKARYSQAGGPICAFNVLTPGSYTVKLTVTKGIPWAAPGTGEAPYNFLVGDFVTYLGNTYVCATAHAQSGSIVPGSHANWTLSVSGLVQATTTINITADDPDVTYAGTATVCINNAGTSDGLGPSGCTYASSVGTPASNKRYLFKKGQSHPDPNSVQFGTSGIFFGSYGSGAQPIVDNINMAESNSLDTFPHTVVVSGIDMKRSVWVECPVRITLYNCTLTRDNGSGNDCILDMGSQCTTYFNSGSYSGNKSIMPWSRESMLFENTIIGTVLGTDHPNLTVMGYFMKSALVANIIDKADEFSLRMFGAAKTFLGHNEIRGHCQAGSKGALKIHSTGNYVGYNDLMSVTGTSFPNTSLGATGGMQAWEIVLADNIFGSTDANNVDWTAANGPQNHDGADSAPYGTTEFSSRLIWERCSFLRGSQTSQDMHALGNCLVTRGNVAPAGTFNGDVDRPGTYPTPDPPGTDAGHGAGPIIFDYGRTLMPSNCGPYYGQLV